MLQQPGLEPVRSGFGYQAQAHGRRLVLCSGGELSNKPFRANKKGCLQGNSCVLPAPLFTHDVFSQIQFTFFPFAGFNSINFIVIQLIGVKIFFLSQKEIKACLL